MSFWNWLEENTDWIQAPGSDLDAHSDKIGVEFEKHFPELNWEIEITEEGPWFFIISADCDPEKFSDVIAAYQSAPALEHWVLFPFRQPGSLETRVEIPGGTLGYDDVWCEVSLLPLAEPQQIELTILIPDFDDENEDELADAGYQLLDNALGEFDVATFIAEVSFAALDAIPLQTEHRFPLGDLPEYIERLQESELASEE